MAQPSSTALAAPSSLPAHPQCTLAMRMPDSMKWQMVWKLMTAKYKDKWGGLWGEWRCGRAAGVGCLRALAGLGSAGSPLEACQLALAGCCLVPLPCCCLSVFAAHFHPCAGESLSWLCVPTAAGRSCIPLLPTP